MLNLVLIAMVLNHLLQEESDLMKTMTPYPETEKDKLFQKQVNTWKSKINEILVSPFNYKSWTQI